MKTYTSIDSLKKDWYTIQTLLQILEDQGYAHTYATIVRWERKGTIPKARRVQLSGVSWRVYDKKGADFGAIILGLAKLPKRIG